MNLLRYQPFITCTSRALCFLSFCMPSALAADAPGMMGHWRFGIAPRAISHLHLEADGRFRWAFTRTGSPKPLSDYGGTYKVIDGIIELYYDSNPPTTVPQKWKYSLEDDTLTIQAISRPEKMMYKRVSEER